MSKTSELLKSLSANNGTTQAPNILNVGTTGVSKTSQLLESMRNPVSPSIKSVTGNQQSDIYNKPENIYLESSEERGVIKPISERKEVLSTYKPGQNIKIPEPLQYDNFWTKVAKFVLPKKVENVLGLNKTDIYKNVQKSYEEAYAISDRNKLLKELEKNQGVLPKKEFNDVFKDTTPADYLPFISAFDDIKQAVDTFSALKRYEKGENTPQDDYLLLKVKSEAQRDSTFGAKVAGVLKELPSFAGELLLTGGLATVTKKAVEKSIIKTGTTLAEKSAIKRIGIKSLSNIAAGTVQTIPARGFEIIAGVIQNMTPDYSFKKDELNNFVPFIEDQGDSVPLAIAKSFGDQWVEVVSEKSGGLFNEITTPIKNKLLKTSMFSIFNKLNPQLTPNKFIDLVKKAGWNGLIAEMGEERIGDLMRGALNQIGLSDQEFKLPTKEQLLTELVAFSIPSAGISIANNLQEDKQEKNSFRELFKESVKDDLKKYGMNKPYVARKVSESTGLDIEIVSDILNEVEGDMKQESDSIKVQEIDNDIIMSEAVKRAEMVQEEETKKETTKVSSETEKLIKTMREEGSSELEITQAIQKKYNLSIGKAVLEMSKHPKKALNEAGSTLEETKIEEASTAEAKMKISKEEQISGPEVLKYAIALGGETIHSNAKEAIKSQNYQLQEVKISDILKNDLDAQEYVDANKNRYGKQKQGVDNPIIIGEWQGKPNSVIDGYNRILTKIQQGETTMKAYVSDKAQGDTKMKIKDSLTDEQRDEISKTLTNIDTTPITVNGKPLLEDVDLYFRLDQLKTKNEKGKLTNADYLEAMGLLEEAGVGIDTLKTKEDNKVYEKRGDRNNGEGNNGEVQPNGGRVSRGGIWSETINSVAKRYPTFDFRKNEGNVEYASISIRRGEEEAKVREVLEWLLPEAQTEVIDNIIQFNSKLEEPLVVHRTNEVDGNSGFIAAIRPLLEGEHNLYLNSVDIQTLNNKDIWHEGPGHKGFEYLSEQEKIIRAEEIKKQYELTPELFSNFIKKDAKAYWDMSVDFIKYYIKNANPGVLDEVTAYEILNEVGLTDENGSAIIPEDVMEASFNFEDINKKIDKALTDRKFKTTKKTQPQNLLMIDEINSYIAESPEIFKDSEIEGIAKFSNNILDGKYEFKKIEVNIKPKSGQDLEFGGVTFKLKESTNLTAKDIIRKHANIQLKRDTIITDVYGNKATLKAGEGITPYEVTGNKFILQDGEAPQVKVSGKLPFTEQITAPAMFKIKLPEVNTGNKAEDAKQILAHVEKKLGVTSVEIKTGDPNLDEKIILESKENLTEIKPGPRKVKVSGKEVKLSKELEQKTLELEFEGANYDDNPLNKLWKYANKKEGVLPEVTGERGGSIFAQIGDELTSREEFMRFADRDGYIDNEVIREKFQEFFENKKDYLKRLKEHRSEVKKFINLEKDSIGVKKVIEQENKKIEADILKMQQDKNRILKNIEMRKKMEETQARIREEKELEQKRISDINRAFTTPIEEMKWWQRLITQPLNPLKYTDKKTQNIFKEWNKKILEGRQRANKEASEFINIPIKEGPDVIWDYENGKETKYSNEIRKKFNSLLAEARNRGVDMGFRDNYLPHIYKENAQKIKENIEKYLLDKGLTKDQITAYENGTKLPDAIVNTLKINPFFSKERVFPTYQVAMQYGINPKYSNPAQLIGYYIQEMETIIANNELVQELESEGRILPFEDAPLTWEMVNLPFSQKGYNAPKNIAKVINGLFKNQEPTGWTFVSKISKKMQEIKLSAGLPYTTINFFAIGAGLVKEVTAGNFKAINAFFRANFNSKSIKWLQENRKYMEMMAHQGINQRETLDSWENLYFSLKNIDGFMGKTGELFDQAFGDKTFMAFMPMLQIQLFKDSYHKLLDKGYPQEISEELAGRIVSNNFGLSDFSGRSKVTQDKLSAIFFAPQFREGIINSLTNTGKAGYDLVKNLGGIKSPLDPTLVQNRKLLIGMIITFLLYNLLNAYLNDDGDDENGKEWMWNNPKNRKFALQIPTDDGTLVYVEFMPSYLAFARNMFSGVIGLGTGDFKTAGQKFGSVFSMPIKTTTEILSNSDYFGNPIYKETDTGLQASAKIAKYIGLSVSHPYITEIINQIYDKKPLYQSIIIGLELPLKFSSWDKVKQGEYYDALDAKAKENAQIKNKIKPTYDKVQELKDAGKIKEATDLYNTLTEDQKIVFNKIKQNPYDVKQVKNDVYEEAIKSLKTKSLGEVRKNITKELYGDKPTNDQKSMVNKEFAYYQEYDGYKYKKEADEFKGLSNENKILFLQSLKKKISPEAYREFLAKGRKSVRLSSGKSSPLLISDEVLKRSR